MEYHLLTNYNCISDWRARLNYFIRWRSTLATHYIATSSMKSFGWIIWERNSSYRKKPLCGIMSRERVSYFLHVSFGIFALKNLNPLHNANKNQTSGLLMASWGTSYTNLIIWILRTVIVAVVVPELDLFISLVGALCLSTVGIAFPAMITMLVKWKYRHDTFNYTLTLIAQGVIFSIAVMILITGLSTTIEAFVETLWIM